MLFGSPDMFGQGAVAGWQSLRAALCLHKVALVTSWEEGGQSKATHSESPGKVPTAQVHLGCSVTDPSAAPEESLKAHDIILWKGGDADANPRGQKTNKGALPVVERHTQPRKNSWERPRAFSWHQ